MKIEAILNLDEVVVDEWETTVSEIVLSELKCEIIRQVKTAVKNDPKLKKAIRAIQTRAAEQIIAAMEKEQS